ncbi:MAG: type II toxin-antitoxin system PemK/MazF family toxin [Acidobacteria bacterium]|nr:type II toxin-antitoxin system PemK/MazF family toxin [Acidobacteriota bacterium]
MRPGDVVIAAFPGVQETKARPAVVLSTEEYHRFRPDVILGMITTQSPRSYAPSDHLLTHWREAGLHAPSYFRLFVVTLPQSKVRVTGRLSDADWSSVQRCMQSGLDPISGG